MNADTEQWIAKRFSDLAASIMLLNHRCRKLEEQNEDYANALATLGAAHCDGLGAHSCRNWFLLTEERGLCRFGRDGILAGGVAWCSDHWQEMYELSADWEYEDVATMVYTLEHWLAEYGHESKDGRRAEGILSQLQTVLS